ncbi:putative quinol monooxygenase [Rhizobium halophytocola]|uniref:Quinol monooxygenase YgiN n=1 Tax=Rhizobium halophytocola TaxID=735519 RepID=A0ABS4DWJ8_9HYPH|nr:antibiotic biosynthesis monooxygenase family protein [Rhizobium halophytocola]MBP1850048.1 quinol monooxygenase YgiN [Rhizobium halophytocola]
MIRPTSPLLATALGALVSATNVQAQTPSETYARLDAAPYGLLVKLPIHAGQRQQFLKLIKSRIAESRAMAEVIDFEVLSTPDDNTFIAVERFRDKAAAHAFEALPETKRFLNSLKPMLGPGLEATVLTPLP